MLIQILDRSPRRVQGVSKKTGRAYDFHTIEAALVRMENGTAVGQPFELNFEGPAPAAGLYEADAEQLVYASRARKLAIALRPEHLRPVKQAVRNAA